MFAFFVTIAEKIWGSTWGKELFLFVVTSLTLVLIAQLQALDTLFAGGASLDELKVWLQAFASAVGITAIRQAIAYVVAHLAGSAL